MASSRKDGLCYLDGVHVKVSEKFRPPRRIVLPMGLTRNFYPQTLHENYDFDLEVKTIEFAERYRQEQEFKRQARTDRVAADIEHFTQHPAQERSGVGDASSAATNSVPAAVVNAATVTSASILQPAPAPETVSTAAAQPVTTQKSFSLAEFENESSSPFDYVELQTINDLEELSSVFQGMTVQSPQAGPRKPEDSTGVPTWQGPPPTEVPPARESDIKASLHVSRSASDVRCSSDKGANRRTVTPPAQPSPQSEPNRVEMHQLEQDQAAAKEVAVEMASPLLHSLMDMGFDRNRAQRALQSQGSTDDKKVVEYLCQVQSLVDAGFSDMDAEEALQINSGNYEQALEFLQLQQQFMALGFKRDAISKALVQAQNDRDKALDLLLG
uniref:UBA domain-containing protein n=1 Tax=Amblyomma maculatum TaxID=34609 RepID=G3MMA8_AMBMU